MTVSPPPHLSLSEQDQSRIAQLDRLAGTGAAGVSLLIEALEEPSWVVRRGVIAALARHGDGAIPALCEQLRKGRSSETRIAATVDALVLSRGDVESALTPLAKDPNPAVICDVAQILGRRKSGPAVPLLKALTAYPDDNVAIAAIEALGRIGGGSAVSALIDAASTGNFFRTFPAIDVLGRSGDPASVPTLLALLEQPVYASEAIRALGRSGDERAIRPLLRLFQTPGDTLVRATALALAEISGAQEMRFGNAHVVDDAVREEALPTSLGRRLGASLEGATAAETASLCRVLGWVGGEEAIECLLQQLHGPAEVHRAAAKALTELGRAADAQLVSKLRSPDSREQLAVLPFLGRRGIAVAEVLGCLGSEDGSVRAAACEALGRLGDPQVTQSLFPLLGDPDALVSQAALAAIQALGSPITEALTLEAARSPDPRVRRAAIRIIAYFGYPSGLSTLLAAMSEEDARLRDAAIYGLPFIEDPRAYDALVTASQHPSQRTRAAAMRALGQTPSTPQTLSVLRGGLQDPDGWVRYYAVQSLGKLRDASTAHRLIEMLDDDAGQVRVAVVDALSLINNKATTAALQRAAQSKDPDVKRAALLGLGVAGREDSLPLLLSALEEPEAATRLVALSALAELEGPGILPALTRAARDPEASVRNAAVGFLAARQGPAATRDLVELLSDDALRELVLSSLAVPVEGRIQGLLAALHGADDRVAPLLVGALARMNRADSAAAILEGLRSASVPGRKACAQSVAGWGNAPAKAALERAAREDADPEVRRISALALVP